MAAMHLAALYVYPIKSLRAVSLPSAQMTPLGLPHDRTFMLLEVLPASAPDTARVTENGGRKYKNMHISEYNDAALFHPTIVFPDETAGTAGEVKVEYRPVSGESRELKFPLVPDTKALAEIEVVMHRSPTRAYVMPERCNAWFSAYFGREVVLAYLGEHRRPVRMSHPLELVVATAGERAAAATGWLGGLVQTAGSYLRGDARPDAEISFADCAPYLVVSARSLDDVHPRLEDGEEMDVTKFRPNLVIAGAAEPWEEDFWGELAIGAEVTVTCVHNCGRCRSINVDYATGAQGTPVLKRLMKDRRVDPGMKYSPIFGRYSFLQPACAGRTVHVGDPVRVTKVNDERTVFDWDGLATTS